MDTEKKLEAELLSCEFGKADVKLRFNGALHILRWRRKLLRDELLLDDKLVSASGGLVGRERIFGFLLESEDGASPTRFLFALDRASDMTGAPRGVLLECDDGALLRSGSYAHKDAHQRPGGWLDRMFEELGLA